MSDHANQGAGSATGRSVGAIVGLVLGIIALVTSFLPIINNLSALLALVGAIFAVVGLVGTLRGKKTGKGMAIASVIINVLAIVIVLGTQSMYSAAIDEATKGVMSTTDGTSLSLTQQASTDGDSSQKYTITDEELTGDQYSCAITGTFTNTSGTKVSYVQVSYNLFDADGAQIGTALANTSNLAADGTWKFEAFGTAAIDEVASYQLSDVTGF